MTRKHRPSIAISALAASLALSLPALVWADHDGATIPVTRIDSYLQASMQGQKIPGLSVAVLRDGTLALARSYGLANVEQEAPAAPGTVFEIGTLTRQFTAVGVMMLVEQGKIALDDPILTIIPELPRNWSPVTVRHLLSHTSGIPSYTNAPGFWSHRESPISRSAILASVADMPLEFQSGGRASVSSTNYFVLGQLIEVVSGQSYAKFMTERIFQPLGMGATRVNDYGAVIKNRAAGYTLQESASAPVPSIVRNAGFQHPSRLFGEGSLVSSVYDMARWYRALVAGRVVKPATLAQMWTPAKLNDGTTTRYGFGWNVRTSPQGATLIEQGGALAGFRSQVIYYPQDRTGVILFGNSDRFNPYTLAADVHRIVAGDGTVIAR